MKTDRFRQTFLDHEVESLQGYLGLGMQRQCLATAKRLLRRPQLTAHAFAEAVDAILIQGGNLRRWQPWIEAAHDRLSSADRKQVRFQMLGFYVSRKEWKSAEGFVPKRSDNPAELLFAMWTLLELRRDSSAKRIYRQCRKLWRTRCLPLEKWTNHEVEISSLIEAIACYLAQAGRWREAETWWHMGTTVRPFTPNAWDGLIKLHTIRAIVTTKTALKVSENADWRFADDTRLEFPSDQGKPQNQEDQLRFRKFESHLSRLVPEKERFRFNAAMP